MADGSVNVKITAEASGFVGGTQQASQATQQLAAAMQALQAAMAQFSATVQSATAAAAAFGQTAAQATSQTQASTAALQQHAQAATSAGSGYATMASHAASLHSQLRQLRTMLSDLREPFLAIKEIAELAGVGFAIEKLVETVREIAEFGERTENISFALGVDAGQYALFATSLQLVGGNAESASRGLVILESKLTEALTNPASKAREGFLALGASIKDMEAGFADPIGFLTKIAEGATKLDAAARGTALRDSFGRQLREIAPYLKDGIEGIERLNDVARQTGIPINDEDLHKLSELGEAFNRLGRDLFGFGAQITLAVEGPIAKLIEGLSSAVEQASRLIATARTAAPGSTAGLPPDVAREVEAQHAAEFGLPIGGAPQELESEQLREAEHQDYETQATGGATPRADPAAERKKLEEAIKANVEALKVAQASLDLQIAQARGDPAKIEELEAQKLAAVRKSIADRQSLITAAANIAQNRGNEELAQQYRDLGKGLPAEDLEAQKRQLEINATAGRAALNETLKNLDAEQRLSAAHYQQLAAEASGSRAKIAQIKQQELADAQDFLARRKALYDQERETLRARGVAEPAVQQAVPQSDYTALEVEQTRLATEALKAKKEAEREAAEEAIKGLEAQRRALDERERSQLASIERMRRNEQLTVDAAESAATRIIEAHRRMVDALLGEEARLAQGQERLQQEVADRRLEIDTRADDALKAEHEKAEVERLQRAKEIDKELATSLAGAISSVAEHHETWRQAIGKLIEGQEKKLLEKGLENLFQSTGIGQELGGLGELFGFGGAKMTPEEALKSATSLNTGATDKNTASLDRLTGKIEGLRPTSGGAEPPAAGAPGEPGAPGTPAATMPPGGEKYAGTIREQAAALGIPQPIAYNLFGAESNFRPEAEGPPVASRGGERAFGLGQMMPAEARQYGGNTTDPTAQITAALRYLADLHARLGSWTAAVRAYGGSLEPYLHERSPFGPALVASAQAADKGGPPAATASPTSPSPMNLTAVGGRAIAPGVGIPIAPPPGTPLPAPIDKTAEAGFGERFGKMDQVSGMIVHHTASRGTADDVIRTFKQTNFPAQFVIDRQGETYRTIPEGFQGQHIQNGWGTLGEGRTNRNMQGVEIIARNDADVLPIQQQAAARLIAEQAARYGYDPKTDVLGHGEVNPGHKEATEGMSTVSRIRSGELPVDQLIAAAKAQQEAAADLKAAAREQGVRKDAGPGSPIPIAGAYAEGTDSTSPGLILVGEDYTPELISTGYLPRVPAIVDRPTLINQPGGLKVTPLTRAQQLAAEKDEAGGKIPETTSPFSAALGRALTADVGVEAKPGEVTPEGAGQKIGGGPDTPGEAFMRSVLQFAGAGDLARASMAAQAATTAWKSGHIDEAAGAGAGAVIAAGMAIGGMIQPEAHSVETAIATERAVEAGSAIRDMVNKVPGRGGIFNPLPVPVAYQDHLRRLLNRAPDVAQIQTPAIELAPGIFIGNVSLDQWISRTETQLNPEELKATRAYYQDALPVYEEYFGEDLAPTMLGAWLVANVHVSGSGAQANATRVLEQLTNRTGDISVQKKGGLTDEALRQYWSAVHFGEGELTGEGSGVKIYDFIDSGLGKTTRTFYGDDPRAGSPAVADVHSLRDMGYVDPALRNWIVEQFGVYSEPIGPGLPSAGGHITDQLSIDMSGGGASMAMYEVAASKMRAFTEELNTRGYAGGGWTPAELQAVGWTAMSRMTGRAAVTSREAIEANVRNISYELDFGKGAPFTETFPEWEGLSQDQKAAVTGDVLPGIVDFAKSITAAHEYARVEGIGGWQGGTQPSFKSQLIASPEVAGDTADIIGYLAQQTKVMGYRAIGGGKKVGVALYGDDLGDPDTIRSLWEHVNNAVPGMKVGFSPATYQGTPGIHIILEKGGKGSETLLNTRLRPAIDAASSDLGINVTALPFKVEEVSREHDWTKDPTGESYLARLRARYGPDLPGRLELYSRQELEPAIRASIARHTGAGSSIPERASVGPGEGRPGGAEGLGEAPGSAEATGTGAAPLEVPAYAEGTDSTAPGLIIVGEDYTPELISTGYLPTVVDRPTLINQPGGLKVTPLSRAQQLAAEKDQTSGKIPEPPSPFGSALGRALTADVGMGSRPGEVTLEGAGQKIGPGPETPGEAFTRTVLQFGGAEDLARAAMATQAATAAVRAGHIDEAAGAGLGAVIASGMAIGGIISPEAKGAEAAATVARASTKIDEALRSAEIAAGGYPRLEGLPAKPIKVGDEYYVPGPLARAQEAAETYMAQVGLPYNPPRQYSPVDPERATRIAAAFDEMKHDPTNPAVKASYDALVKETLAQWQVIKETGLQVEWIKPGEENPYVDGLNALFKDVRENNHLWEFPTDLGFGSDPAMQINNPMLQPTGEVVGGRQLVANDVFRIVHDYFGHFKEGVGFRARGEENAWRSHAAMYSELARPAMTAETRGQNSWVNYGPYGEANRTAGAAETVYAPQTIGMMPAWVMEEGRLDLPTLQDAAAEVRTHEQRAQETAALAQQVEAAEPTASLFEPPQTTYQTPGGIAAGSEPRTFVLERERLGRWIARDQSGKEIGRAGAATDWETGGVKPFIESSQVSPSWQRGGVATALYKAIEQDIGRDLVPSPLGLSGSATGLWKKRLAAVSPAKREELLAEAKEIGLSYGVSEADVEGRLAPLQLPEGLQEEGVRVFHASPHEFSDFDFTKIGDTTDQGALGAGAYFSTDPQILQGSPFGYETTVTPRYPLRLQMTEWPIPGRDLGSKHQLVTDALGLPADSTSEQIRDAALARGHDAVVLDYTPLGYNHQEIAAFKPEVVGPLTQRATDHGFEEEAAPVESPAIRAFHGSPHDFEAFDITKIGTGEGSQSFGHGLYFAQNEQVALTYRPPYDLGAAVRQAIRDGKVDPFSLAPDSSLPDIVQDFIYGHLVSAQAQGFEADKHTLEDAANHIPFAREPIPEAPLGGHGYEVNIQADPEHFLHWDKPLSQQSPELHAALKAADIKLEPREIMAGPGPSEWRQPTGMDAYYALSTRLGSDAAASEALKNAGVPGIRYLDQGSRSGAVDLTGFDVSRLPPHLGRYIEGSDTPEQAAWDVREQLTDIAITGQLHEQYLPAFRDFLAQPATAGEGTSNFVVFDDRTIEIIRKYGIAGLMAGGGAAAVAGDQAQAAPLTPTPEPGQDTSQPAAGGFFHPQTPPGDDFRQIREFTEMPGFSTGTGLTPPGPYLVGEGGPELAVGAGMQIIPAGKTREILASAETSETVSRPEGFPRAFPRFASGTPMQPIVVPGEIAPVAKVGSSSAILPSTHFGWGKGWEIWAALIALLLMLMKGGKQPEKTEKKEAASPAQPTPPAKPAMPAAPAAAPLDRDITGYPLAPPDVVPLHYGPTMRHADAGNPPVDVSRQEGAPGTQSGPAVTDTPQPSEPITIGPVIDVSRQPGAPGTPSGPTVDAPEPGFFGHIGEDFRSFGATTGITDYFAHIDQDFQDFAAHPPIIDTGGTPEGGPAPGFAEGTPDAVTTTLDTSWPPDEAQMIPRMLWSVGSKVLEAKPLNEGEPTSPEFAAYLRTHQVPAPGAVSEPQFETVTQAIKPLDPDFLTVNIREDTSMGQLVPYKPPATEAPVPGSPTSEVFQGYSGPAETPLSRGAPAEYPLAAHTFTGRNTGAVITDDPEQPLPFRNAGIIDPSVIHTTAEPDEVTATPAELVQRGVTTSPVAYDLPLNLWPNLTTHMQAVVAQRQALGLTSPIITMETTAGPKQYYMTGEQTVSMLRDQAGSPPTTPRAVDEYIAGHPDLFTTPYRGADAAAVAAASSHARGFLSSPESYGTPLRAKVAEPGQWWADYGKGFEPTGIASSTSPMGSTDLDQYRQDLASGLSAGDDIGHLAGGQVIRPQDLLHNQALRQAYDDWEANPQNRARASTTGENPVFDQDTSNAILAEQRRIEGLSAGGPAPDTFMPPLITPSTTQEPDVPASVDLSSFSALGPDTAPQPSVDIADVPGFASGTITVLPSPTIYQPSTMQASLSQPAQQPGLGKGWEIWAALGALLLMLLQGGKKGDTKDAEQSQGSSGGSTEGSSQGSSNGGLIGNLISNITNLPSRLLHGLIGNMFDPKPQAQQASGDDASLGDELVAQDLDITKLASGTSGTPPGMILVGEEGPELITQPGGLSVFPADKTQAMLAGKAFPGFASGTVVVPGEIAPIATSGSAAPILPSTHVGLGKGWEIWAALFGLLMMLMGGGKGGGQGQKGDAGSKDTGAADQGSDQGSSKGLIGNIINLPNKFVHTLFGNTFDPKSAPGGSDAAYAARDVGDFSDQDAADLGGDLVASDIGTPPSLASGTSGTPPGMILVGESGPELITQPGGLSVLPADKTAQVLAGTHVPGFADGTVAIPETQTLEARGFEPIALRQVNPAANYQGLTEILGIVTLLQKLLGSGGGGLFGGLFGGSGGSGGGGGGIFSGIFSSIFGGGNPGSSNTSNSIQNLGQTATNAGTALQGLTSSSSQASSGLLGLGSKLFSGLGGILGGGGAGGGGFLGAIGGVFGAIFGAAGGTEDTPPGPILVGERGPEIITQPGGEKVFTADQTRSMLLGESPQASGGALPPASENVSAHASPAVPPPPMRPASENVQQGGTTTFAPSKEGANINTPAVQAAMPPPGSYTQTAPAPPLPAPTMAGAGSIAYMMPGITGIPHLDNGAWELDQDLFAQLHKGEQVVPQEYADGIRSSLSRGMGGDTHIHQGDQHTVSIQAIDTQTGHAFLMRHYDSVAQAAYKGRRNGSQFTQRY